MCHWKEKYSIVADYFAPHALPHALDFSSFFGSAAPHALPHADGFSSFFGSAEPHALPHGLDE